MASPIPSTMTSKSSEVLKVAEIRQELSDIVEGGLYDDRHADTCLLEKGWRTLVVHDYSENFSGFSYDIEKLDLLIVDNSTTIRTDNDNEMSIRMNQALSKPDKDVSLMSNFQVGYNGT